MMLKTQEHIDLMVMFEKEYGNQYRMDREDKALWTMANTPRIYQSGEVNALFLAYRKGYVFGKVVGRDD